MIVAFTKLFQFPNPVYKMYITLPVEVRSYSLHKIRMKTLVIFCAVLASVYTYSEACSCFPQHPQVQFCNADFGRFF